MEIHMGRLIEAMVFSKRELCFLSYLIKRNTQYCGLSRVEVQNFAATCRGFITFLHPRKIPEVGPPE